MTSQAIILSLLFILQISLKNIIFNPKGYVSEPMFSFPGSEFVAEAIKGTMDTITDFLGINKPSTPTMVTKKCISCGANIEGVSGTICKCPFCGTSQEL